MKTQKVTFGARYLPNQVTKKMQNVLLKMNSQTTQTKTKTVCESNILNRLETGLGSITDCRFLFKTKRSNNGKASIAIKKIAIEVDIKTGEILPASKKPFFSSWKSAYRKIGSFLDTLQSNFDNKNIVKKIYVKVRRFTQIGEDKFRELARINNKMIED